MNSPYMGRFRVSQIYKGTNHDGLDLVGIDSKEIHSTVNGIVLYAGWENAANHDQGFGQYVKIKRTGTNEIYYFGHLSELRVKMGDSVRITDLIGIEGSTGRSTGSHCHYCMRIGGKKGAHRDISVIAKIPNVCGTYDDGYRMQESTQAVQSIRKGCCGGDVKSMQIALICEGYDCGRAGADGICGKDTVAAIRAYQRDHSLTVDGVCGKNTRRALGL